MNPVNRFNATVGHYDAFCSVCKIRNAVTSIMVPATNKCPVKWNLIYKGYLMTPKRNLQRTQYICVDEKPNLKTTDISREVGFLNFVGPSCKTNDLPCRTKHYIENYELPCVVCAM